MADSHFPLQFQISARAETSHVIATKFHPGGRAEISTRAEIRHVIGPFGRFNHKNILFLIFILIDFDWH